MKPKFTPGPWKFSKDQYSVDQGSSYPWRVSRDDPNDPGLIASRFSKADAALVAAAPEMYEALAELVRCWAFNKGSLELDEIAVEHIEAVLKKARGES